jgi:hypothetical protein
LGYFPTRVDNYLLVLLDAVYYIILNADLHPPQLPL